MQPWPGLSPRSARVSTEFRVRRGTVAGTLDAIIDWPDSSL
jgi:hypothetical protein